MIFAPVLIITLDRHEKFKRCVESLRDNLYADNTDLFVALDYPKTADQFDGYYKTLSFIQQLNGFREIHVLRREENYGIGKNYLDAKNYLFSKYDSVIFSEDDNEFSNDFLNFMNKCLDKYREEKRIFSISGFNYPVMMPSSYKANVYQWIGHSAWGFGIWKDRWQQLDFTDEAFFERVRKFLLGYVDVYRFQAIANHYFPAMLSIVLEKKKSGDGYICLHQFLNNYTSVFPVVSRVRNHGHDGSGRSQSFLTDSSYAKIKLYSGAHDYELPDIVSDSESVNKVLYDFFKISNWIRIRLLIKLLLTNFSMWPLKQPFHHQ